MIRQLLLDFAATKYCSVTLRLRIYRYLGMLTNDAYIESNTAFTNTNLCVIRVGKNTYINEYCYFENNAPITIGNNVAIAMYCKFITTTHPVSSSEKRVRQVERKSISVGNGSWICSNVTILPNVNIGKGCIIAAGSVVTKDCKDNYMYGGVPAKKIKYLGE